MTPAEKYLGISAARLQAAMDWPDRTTAHKVLNWLHSQRARNDNSRRTSAWQAKMLALGLCITCGKNPLATKNHCATCRDRHAARKRLSRSNQKTAADK